ncbi:hypothetical protein MUK72_10110 [Halococcus dombrowskii]|uniref:Uncharacterized protein n=1 Tax=Halococcus dombrowskii TaxID=179637 RepID=A0AAV3SD77_HALDO|nr:hypothetical protein [Halococcus dombrowskii]UOO94324.1 hypothetical protein MUK72_10110 [Halococcus dombrowskii]
MVTDIGLLYVGGMSLLFVFWAYGLVSFVLDVKNMFIPLTRQYLRGRRREKEEAEREAEREEREEQLY